MLNYQAFLNGRLQDIVILMYKVKYWQLLISFVIFSELSLVNIILETKILIFLDLILYCMVNTLLDILDPFYGTSSVLSLSFSSAGKGQFLTSII